MSRLGSVFNDPTRSRFHFRMETQSPIVFALECTEKDLKPARLNSHGIMHNSASQPQSREHARQHQRQHAHLSSPRLEELTHGSPVVSVSVAACSAAARRTVESAG